MIAITFEIGSELRSLLTPLVVALVGLIAVRKQQKEFKPNGGSTMRDAVDRIEQRLGNVDTTVTEVRAEQIAIKARVDDLESKAIPVRRASDQLPPPPPPPQ